MNHINLIDRIEIIGWQDYVVIAFLVLVGAVLFILFLRGGGPRGH